MRLFVKGPLAAGVIALALTGAGAAGTAYAAEPANSGAAIVAAQPGTPHGKFHRNFRSLQDCEREADRLFPGRRDDWRCVGGPDRNNPWDLWSR